MTTQPPALNQAPATDAQTADLAGGGKPWAMELTPWSFWCQTTDWTADGQPDENRFNNCGPECVAMIVKYITDVELPADYIHDVVAHEGTTGYTNLGQLSEFLTRYCHTECETYFPVQREKWLWLIWQALTEGHPLIGLFSFAGPGTQDGHFRCIIGMNSSQELICADPWNGKRRVESWDVAFSWAKGPLIHVKRKRDVAV